MTMTISGDGTIGGLVAGGLPNATIVQADLATGVAGTGPAFSAYSSTGTSVNNNVFTKILYQTEEYDTHNSYDNSISRFQPNIAGYYQINWATGATTQAEKFAALYKNGNFYRAGCDIIGWWSSGTALVYMNGTTDYLEVYFYQLTGATVSTYTTQPAFSGSLIRTA